MLDNEAARASGSGARRAGGGAPGIWAALVIAGMSGLGLGYLVQPGAPAPGAAASGIGGRLAEVAPQDLPAAIGTVDAPPEQLARLKAPRACGARLAWITIMRQPGQPAGRIRLQSGHYFSPAFELTETPVRVALPYPAPYEAGRGTIAVLGTTADAIVALTPPWHVAVEGGVRAQEVTWTPVGACPAGQGQPGSP